MSMATEARSISARTRCRSAAAFAMSTPCAGTPGCRAHDRGPSATLAAAMEKPKILTARELRAIMPRLSGWKLAQNKLSRTFEFQDFVQSLSFVNSLVAYFETVDHHPDVRIAYGEVTFELTRYDLGGKVTDRDVEVAKKISSLYRARSQGEPNGHERHRLRPVMAAFTSTR